VLWLSVLAFAVAWWLGLYLLARDPRKPALRLAAVGLIGYAVAIAVDQFDAGWTDNVALPLMCVPAVAWSGVFVALADDGGRFDRWWRLTAPPLLVLLSVLVLAGVDAARVAIAVFAVLALVAGAVVLLLHRPAEGKVRGGLLGLLLLAAPLVGLGSLLPLLELEVVSRGLLLAGIAPDLVLLGVVIAVFDAFDEGQALAPDMSRSLLIAGGAAVLFGGQVGVAIAVTGQRPALVLLLYGTVAAAIAVLVLLTPIQAAVDRVALRSSRLRHARDELREVADALPRKAVTELAALPDGEFARLTRRAISHYGDLGKLVSSPLVDLPLIDARLAERGVPDAPLERATELKAVLLESIARLKPAGGEEFGTSEEWRHYNALFFYYVRGIRPYSVRTKRTDIDPASRQALSWFADQVPERTLHNWQNVAARVIAEDLRAGLPARVPQS
jgi:hypothetical protein